MTFWMAVYVAGAALSVGIGLSVLNDTERMTARRLMKLIAFGLGWPLTWLVVMGMTLGRDASKAVKDKAQAEAKAKGEERQGHDRR